MPQPRSQDADASLRGLGRRDRADLELAIHLRMALRRGRTEEELTEVLLHLSGYVGAPLVREAFLTARRVFAEMKAGN